MAPKLLILTPFTIKIDKTQVNEQFWSNLQSCMIFFRSLNTKNTKNFTEIGQKIAEMEITEIAKNIQKQCAGQPSTIKSKLGGKWWCPVVLEQRGKASK